MIVALLPAHQEEAGITAAIASLQAQTVAPDRIIVVADNCTDCTEQLAAEAGAEVFTTVGNTFRKAGALNQAIATLTFGQGDQLLIMDADTVLAPVFIEVATARLEADSGLAAIGGVFDGEAKGWLQQAQANEWARYARQLRRSGKVQVLSGTAAVIRVEALDAIRAARGTLLPGVQGDVYNRDAATEDFCLTVALKVLGYRLASPSACRTTTELMPTFGLLWAQRKRWYGGALQVLGLYGVRPATLAYFGQQAMLVVAVLGLLAYLLLTGILAVNGTLGLSAWAILGVIFWLERVVTVWSAGWKARLFAGAFFIEVAYDMFLQAAFIASVANRLRSKPIAWVHIQEAVA